jgi:light-regulated signal transduction histidine kinase (bacteriophytochrome)
VLQEFKAETEGRAIEWHTHSLPIVEDDPELIKQVFEILISNAVKFSRTRPKARIEVGSLSDNNHLVFFVRDNGVGFDMAYADKLFGVFQRLHHSDQFEGTGVGLAAAERIIRRHGGRIWVDASLNSGATFYFSLGSQSNGSVSTNVE